MSFGSCFPRRRSAGISLKALLGHTPAVSPIGDRPSSLLGKAASAEGQDAAPKAPKSGGIPCCWSEHRPARDKIWKASEEIRWFYGCVSNAGMLSEQGFGRYCDH